MESLFIKLGPKTQIRLLEDFWTMYAIKVLEKDGMCEQDSPIETKKNIGVRRYSFWVTGNSVKKKIWIYQANEGLCFYSWPTSGMIYPGNNSLGMNLDVLELNEVMDYVPNPQKSKRFALLRDIWTSCRRHLVPRGEHDEEFEQEVRDFVMKDQREEMIRKFPHAVSFLQKISVKHQMLACEIDPTAILFITNPSRAVKEKYGHLLTMQEAGVI